MRQETIRGLPSTSLSAVLCPTHDTQRRCRLCRRAFIVRRRSPREYSTEEDHGAGGGRGVVRRLQDAERDRFVAAASSDSEFAPVLHRRYRERANVVANVYCQI